MIVCASAKVTAAPAGASQWNVATSRPVSRSHTLQRPVPRPGNRPLPVRRHRHAIDPIRVAFQRAQGAARLQVPHLQRLVIRPGNRPLPVRRHRHATDRIGGLPASRSARPVSRSHTFSVWSSTRKPRASRPPSPPRHGPHQSGLPACAGAAGLQVPHLQRLVLRRGNRPPPVRRHRHATDPIRVAFQRAQRAAGLQVPHLQRPVFRRRNVARARPPSPPRQ